MHAGGTTIINLPRGRELYSSMKGVAAWLATRHGSRLLVCVGEEPAFAWLPRGSIE